MFVWFLAALFYMFEVILRVSPNGITDELMSHFQISSTFLGLMTSAYYYAYVPLQIPCGLIVDRFGVRAILSISAIISSIGALIFGYGESYIVGLLARFLIGAGAACAFLSCLKIISGHLPQRFFGYFCGATNLMGTVGALLAGRSLVLTVHHMGWQKLYFLLGGIGLLIALLLIAFIRNTKSDTPLAFSTHLFFDKNMWFMGIASGLMYLPITVFGELWGTPFLSQLHGVSRLDAASMSGVIFMGATLGSLFVAALANQARSYLQIMEWGSILCAILFTSLFVAPLYMVFGIILTIGVVASTQVLSFAWVNDYCGKDSIGTGVGFCNALTMCSGLIFQPLLGYILDLFWSGQYISGIRHYDAIAYTKAMLVIPVCFIITLFILRNIKESHYLSSSVKD